MLQGVTATGDRRPQCFKCKGYDHYAKECINQRVMVIGTDGQVYSEEEGEEELGGDELCPDTNVGFSSDEELCGRMTNLVGVLRTLSVQPKRDECVEQRTNIYMKCKVQFKTCLMIIDGGSCTNVVNEQLVSKLQLSMIKHPTPYRLQWLGDSGGLKVAEQARVPMRIGELEEEVLCDVIPMSACHLLLGRPWEYDNKATKDGNTNECSYTSHG